jgi:hypothetical protein
MHADCAAGTLYVAEPVPLFEGIGAYQRVDLETFSATTLPILENHGEVGGFVMTGTDEGWFITHTEFGPSPSSHLARVTAAGSTGLWATFTPAHIDRLAFDSATSQLFFPDGCTTNCKSNQTTGVQVFDAITTTQLTTTAIDVGFPPIDVVVAR